MELIDMDNLLVIGATLKLRQKIRDSLTNNKYNLEFINNLADFSLSVLDYSLILIDSRSDFKEAIDQIPKVVARNRIKNR